MNTLKVGYASVNIDPPLGIGIGGYYVPRFARGFLDHLEAGVIAASCGNETVVLVSVDHLGFTFPLSVRLRRCIAEKTGIPLEMIFLHATHSHTAPMAEPLEYMFHADPGPIDLYAQFLGSRLADAAQLALDDLKPAQMAFGFGWAPERVAYIRRYRMKNGETCTCPPINDENIVGPIGELDERVNVLRFDREAGPTIVLVNYGLHADTVNGEMISADWPGWMRKTLEASLDVKCIFFNGAEGDVGSTNVHPCGGDLNDTQISFDNEMKSPGMARFIGRALAGTVLQVFDKLEYTDVDRIGVLHRQFQVPANLPDPSALPTAHKYKELHDAGRDAEIPYSAMELTTVVAEAYRMCRLENGPEQIRLSLTGVQIGNIALIGIPGEPFTEIGVEIKKAPDWSLVLPCCLTNGWEGYFPMREAFDEGGYEARSSDYKGGVAESIIHESKELLAALRH